MRKMRLGLVLLLILTLVASAPADARRRKRKRPDLQVITTAVYGPYPVFARSGRPLLLGPVSTPGTPDNTAGYIAVVNNGRRDAVASSTRLHLSPTTSVGAGSVVVGDWPTPAIARSDTSYAGFSTAVVPAGTPAGDYFPIGCADGANVLRESQETNNCRAADPNRTIKVDPNFKAMRVQLIMGWLSVTFNDLVDGTTMTASTFSVTGPTAPVFSTTGTNRNEAAAFVSNANTLAPGTYTVTVDITLKAADGVAIASPNNTGQFQVP